MTEPTQRTLRPWFWIGVLATVVKVWLTRAQPVYAIGPAAHDDRLFLLLAESIAHGNWLGEYSHMTLAKGPFYSIWIAGLYLLGIPIGVGVQLAYAGACALFTRACRPAVRSGMLLCAFYLFLLWNPMSFEGPNQSRVLRQQIYTPLELVVLAGLAALYFRRRETFGRQLRWAGLAGLGFGCFWLTREESVWLVPSVVLLAGAGLFWSFRLSPAQGRTTLKLLALSVACGLLPLAAVSWQNYRHYGWFGTVEMRAAAFKDAYGAMTRVKVGPAIDFVPVTKEARQAMYEVSPAFARLQPFFEGDLGLAWAIPSESMTKLPPEERQIASGWLIWALRDTVTAAGRGHSAREALEFYRALADEINEACDDGRLPAWPRRSGFFPRWREGDTAAVLHTTWEFANFVAGYKSFSAYPHQSIGTDEELRLFRDITRDRLTPAPGSEYPVLPSQQALDEWKIGVLQDVGKALRQILVALFLAAQVVVVARLLQVCWTRQPTFPLVIAASAWGGSLAYLVLNAIVQVTSFPLVAVSTFWPIYPLLQIFTIAVFWDAAAAWFGFPAADAPDGDRTAAGLRDHGTTGPQASAV